MFEKGNKYGGHNNHQRAGRLTEEQRQALAGLVPKSIEVWRKILDMTVQLKGMSVQADVAGKVLNKFVADLIETEENHGITSEFAGLLKDIASGVSGKSVERTAGESDVSKEGTVQG